MYTKLDFLNQLNELGINPTGTLKVHLSYKAIGDVEGGGETVLDALSAYMKDGLLVLPAHSWNNVREQNPVMDVLHTPTCVGAMTELFRKRPYVVRSQHPTHSVAALGKDVEAFVKGEERLETPCGKGGCYYKLWERDAQILLIGVNFNRNTYIHGIEEWDGAKDTLSPNSADYYVITKEGNRIHTPQYRHCAPLGSHTFSKLEPEALHKGILTLGKFGDATARLTTAKALRTMVAAHLAVAPHYLYRH